MRVKLYIFLILFGCYYIFSGINEPFFIISGLIASALGVYVGVKDEYLENPGAKARSEIFNYLPWLAKEIIISTWRVLAHIWSKNPDVEPGFIQLKTKQRHEMGYTLYGNSITLTPGTVCVYINDDENIITAHALTEEGREDLRRGEMDERVLAVVRGED